MLKNIRKSVLFQSFLLSVILLFLFSSCNYSQNKEVTALQELNMNITQLPGISPLQYKDEVFRLLHNIESHILSHENRYWMYKNKSLRDSHMAEHVLWLKELIGNKAKAAVWAHNAHVANDPHYARDGSPAMGNYLKEKLGDNYLVIGTGFTEGRFVAVTEDYFGKDTTPIVWKLNILPPENSVDYFLRQADYKNFILDIKGLSRTGILYKHINKERPFFGVGDFYSATYPEIHFAEDRIINLATAYDMIFYFSDTRPITIIKKEP